MDMPLFLWLTALFTVVSLILSFYSLVRCTRKNPKKNLPREADGGWPLIGHLRLLSGPDPPEITLSNMADKYGPIFSIRLGVHRALIVSSWEIAKECFTTNDIIFSNRPKVAAIEHMGYNFAMFGFSRYGPYWREMRKISMLNLLSNNKVAMLGNLFEIEVRALMRSLYNSCNDKTVPLEMKKFLGDMSLNLMVRLTAGDTEINKGKNEKWRGAIKEFLRLLGILTLPDVFPFLKWLDFFGGTKRAFNKTRKEMDSMLQGWLDVHKKHRKSGKNEGFMTEMMVAANKVAQEFPEYGYDADTINKATCQTMMLGGTDTMTVTLIWALCLLLNNRHTITRAQQELDTHVGRERQVKTSDIENLVYIQSIIKETSRLCPTAPLSPPRESSENCTVAGYHVPAGTRLIINTWKLHRDPRVWADPLEFKPERFLTTHRDIDVRGQHFEFLPFGCGRRICPGISLALQMTELALASLLHGFEIETVSDEAVDMTGSLGATNMKATPLEVLLTPRLSPELYA
ncbi:hypothetical protein DH2020_035097 [Rehmannia glutinosa]|uniref:Cytochrome P450 protein n=1 Tax=Rehmannia glutinosa TaxID=99300 RepID=A0ABR0VAU0_REHGL